MTFSREARRVLDPSLPLGTRVVGLRCCLRHYHPIGFEASFSFLQSMSGNITKDPEALLLAMDLLTTSYQAWQADLRAYGVMRRLAKKFGQRVPHPAAPNPNQPAHWYGARREAAFHAVWVWYSKGASADVDVHCLAAALVQRGRFTSVQRAMFDEVYADLRARFEAVDGTRDFQTYDELRNSVGVMRQMAVVVGNA